MWKKIHSNRDPRDTLYREIRKEFSGYFNIAGTSCQKALRRHPTVAFGFMIVFLSTSACLSFTIFRDRQKPLPIAVKPVNPISTGFSRIIAATAQLNETLYLKKLVDSLGALKNLSQRDSLVLDSALDHLQFKLKH